MRFLVRMIFGVIITLGVMLPMIALVARPIVSSWFTEEEPRPLRKAPERSYTVRTITLEPTTVTPETLAYGRIQAGRTLELRAAQPGRIIDIVPSFRDGAEFGAGAVLMRIDPAATQSREADTRAGLAEARSRALEAEQGATLAEAELESAMRQLSLRRQAMQRQQELLRRGVAARAAVETEQLAVATAEQTVISRQQALGAARNQIEQTRLAVNRAQILVSDAQRESADTDLIAPFSGILDGANAALGRLVTANETLGTLTDPTEMEVAFRLTDAQFGRILDERGAVLPLQTEVSLDLGGRQITTSARIDRAAARAEAEGGRLVYAAVDWRPGLPLRPGDFVRVNVDEPPLSNVAQLPARAVAEDGTIYVIGEDGRVTKTNARVLRRMRDMVVLGDVPFGEKIVGELRPQIGPGVLVQTPEQAAKAAAEAKARRAARGGGRPGAGGKPSSGRPGAASAGAGKPGASKPSDGKPVGNPANGNSTNGNPADGKKPADNKATAESRQSGANERSKPNPRPKPESASAASAAASTARPASANGGTGGGQAQQQSRSTE